MSVFFVGSDHAGTALRAAVVAHLAALGHEVTSFGPPPGERADYPDAAASVAHAVAAQAGSRGILLCGTGIGMSIAANKIPGIRAALVHDPVTARLAAEHNGAHILCLGARLLAEPYALDLIEIWLHATLETRHEARLAKITALERA